MRVLWAVLVAVWAVPVGAADVAVRPGTPPELVLPSGPKFAVFQRFDDVWVVSDDTDLTLTNGATFPVVEALEVSGGSGLRLTYPGLKGLSFVREGAERRIRLAPGTLPSGLPATARQETGLTFPATGTLLRATSVQTRESYPVFVVDTDAGQPKLAEVAQVRLLPAALGGAFVSVEGLPLGVTQNGQGWTLLPMDTPISRAVARTTAPDRAMDNFLEKVLSPDAQVADVSTTLPPISVDEILSRAARRISSTEALERIRAAVERVNQIPTPEVRLPPLPPSPVSPTDVAPVSSLNPEDPSPTGPTALPEDVLVPNFGKDAVARADTLQRRLIQKLTSRDPAERERASYRWAQLKFFLQRYPDASGILRTLPKAEGGFPVLPEARILLGASAVQMERAKDALDILGPMTDVPPAFAPDQALWLAAAKAGAGQHAVAVADFEKAQAQLRAYPPHIQQELRYRWAQALFDLGQFTKATEQIDQLASAGGDSGVLAKAQLMLGRIYLAQGQEPIAEQIFANLTGNRDAFVSNHALFHYLKLLLERGDIPREQAMTYFENMRFLWRGDEVERESTFILGQMMLEEKRYREGLEMLKYLNVYFPQSVRAELATKLMADAFSRLYLKRLADTELDPLAAVSLYYDFRELTPPDTEGDTLIADVADRVAKMGLYRRAIELLDEQLAYRVKEPTLRAMVGLRLARLHRYDFSPEKGLQALASTEAPKLPAPVVQSRNLEKARLHLMDEQPAKALDALKGIDGREASYMAAQAAWRLGDKAQVVERLTPVLADVPTPFTPEDADAVATLAQALSEQGKKAELETLNTRYGEKIAKSRHAAPLMFVRQNAGAAVSATEPGVWTDAVKGVQQYDAFRARYEAQRKERIARKGFEYPRGILPPPSL
jgi:tetratricopeptide (TPR) repeat protein